MPLAHSGTAQGNLSYRGQEAFTSPNAVTHGCGVPENSWAQGDGVASIRERPTFTTSWELCGLALQGPAAPRGGNQVLHQSLGHSNVHGGGEDVVGGLGKFTWSLG